MRGPTAEGPAGGPPAAIAGPLRRVRAGLERLGSSGRIMASCTYEATSAPSARNTSAVP